MNKKSSQLSESGVAPDQHETVSNHSQAAEESAVAQAEQKPAPKKVSETLSATIKELSAAKKKLVSGVATVATAASASACLGGGGGGGGGGATGLHTLTLDFIGDVAVQEGQMLTLNPTASNTVNLAITFSYSGYMTAQTKQTQVGDRGIHQVTVTAFDGVMQASQVVNIYVYNSNPTQQQQHLARRTSFGMTPALFHEIELLGIPAYLNQQLNPSSINDTAFTNRMAGFTISNRNDLKAWTMMHMIYSKRQLLEVMTWFWENHFNTDINTIRGSQQLRDAQEQLERQENEAFRANALGNFRQLLEVSAKSPTMLLYLDSASNRASDSNENYSRELLELHTVGVNGPYSHADIEAGAEIFTGWHLENLQFQFNAAQHNGVQQNYMGAVIPAGGVEQGEMVLDVLAGLPATAQFICSKLVALFVNDTPPPALVTQCAATFQAAVNAPDQIAQVLRVIFNSTEFNDPANYYSKVKTPVEFAASVVRAMQGDTNGNGIQSRVQNMGLDLYENMEPTGYSELGVDWISAGLLLERLKTVEALLRVNNTSNMTVNFVNYFRSNGVTTADQIVDFLLDRFLGQYPPEARTNAINFLNGVSGFSINNSGANTQLRQTVELVMCYPQFQYQ